MTKSKTARGIAGPTKRAALRWATASAGENIDTVPAETQDNVNSIAALREAQAGGSGTIAIK
jgi:hypothetical protein